MFNVQLSMVNFRVAFYLEKDNKKTPTFKSKAGVRVLSNRKDIPHPRRLLLVKDFGRSPDLGHQTYNRAFPVNPVASSAS